MLYKIQLFSIIDVSTAISAKIYSWRQFGDSDINSNEIKVQRCTSKNHSIWLKEIFYGSR